MTVRVPATCGELVQGTLGGQDFLVSCPIDWWIEGRAERRPDGVIVDPPDRAKVRRALERLLMAHATAAGVRVTLSSPFPPGRGLGTSTGDIGAALAAAASALGLPLGPLALTRLALEIEPTDSSLLDGLAVLDHRQGRLIIPLPPPPALEVVVCDPGGAVDTEDFNRVDRAGRWRAVERQTETSLRLLVDGLTDGDPERIGHAASLSARASLAVVPNPLVERLLGLSAEHRALGVVSARSGTVAGLLVSPGAGPEVARRLTGLLRNVAVRPAGVVAGGVRAEAAEAERRTLPASPVNATAPRSVRR